MEGLTDADHTHIKIFFKDCEIVLQVENVILFIDMWKLIINTWEIIIKIKYYHKYWGMINFYSWGILQKPSVYGFTRIEETSELNEDFIKRCYVDSDQQKFPEVDVQYFEKLHNLCNDLKFLPDRMKIEKFEKLVANSHNKKESVIHIRNWMEALNYGLFFNKVGSYNH